MYGMYSSIRRSRDYSRRRGAGCVYDIIKIYSNVKVRGIVAVPKKFKGLRFFFAGILRNIYF